MAKEEGIRRYENEQVKQKTKTTAWMIKDRHSCEQKTGSEEKKKKETSWLSRATSTV